MPALACLAASALLATGCGEVPLRPTLTAGDVAAKAAAAASAPRTRAEIRELLGQPWIASDRWAVDVFRVTGKQRHLLLILAPYPVPVPGISDKLLGYTLVTYSPEGMMDGIDAGFAGDASADDIVLRAGDYTFVHALVDTLSVAPGRFLRDRAPARGDECTLLVGCKRRCTAGSGPGPLCGPCFTRLEVDGGARQELPLVNPTFRPLATGDNADGRAAGRTISEDACRRRDGSVQSSACIEEHVSLAPLTLAAGSHRLSFTSRALEGTVTGELTLPPSGLIYAILTGVAGEPYSMTKQPFSGLKLGAASGTLETSDDVPDGVRDLPVVLNSGGRWLVEPAVVDHAP